VHEKQSLHIDAHTARTRWRGESMDYGLAIDVLLGQERRPAQAGVTTISGPRRGDRQSPATLAPPQLS